MVDQIILIINVLLAFDDLLRRHGAHKAMEDGDGLRPAFGVIDEPRQLLGVDDGRWG